MMRDSIVCTDGLEAMFTSLAGVDDQTILASLRSYGSPDAAAKSILSAFRAMVSAPPLLSSGGVNPVHRLGIVGAASVPTAVWPYLILAELFRIPVKVKVPASDVHHLMALQEIIRQSFEACVTGDVGWNVSTQAGDALVALGFWDDCDRILVFGSDATVDRFHEHFNEPGRVIGFGHVESLLLVDFENVRTDSRWMIDLLAFDHIGCLAPRTVVPVDNCSVNDLVDVMLGKLNGQVSPNIERAVTLRQIFHTFMVSGHPAWLSADGMWLLSSDDSIVTSLVPGHLRIVRPSAVGASKCNIGAVSAPTNQASTPPDIELLMARATWNCRWGMAQFPTMLWRNGGVSIVTTLCR